MRLTTSLLSLALVFFAVEASFAQTCAERLTAAQTAYDEGRIHDLVDQFQQTWGSCLNENNLEFTKEERVQAYRLLTLTYLQLDEPEKADEYMLLMLGTDPEYLLNPSVDPTEFINLYRTFRTDPIFRIGARFGTNTNFSHMKNRVTPYQGAATVEVTPGFQAFVSAEFDLFRNKPTLEKLIFNPELGFVSRIVTDYYEDDFEKVRVVGRFNSLQLNTLAHYNLIMNRRVRVHGTFGISGQYRMSVTDQISTELVTTGEETGGGELLESPNLDVTDGYHSFDMEIIAGGALRLKIGRPWATLDVRYNYGLFQVVKDRFQFYENAVAYGGGLRNDQRFQSFSISAGIHLPIFKHEKLLEE